MEFKKHSFAMIIISGACTAMQACSHYFYIGPVCPWLPSWSCQTAYGNSLQIIPKLPAQTSTLKDRYTYSVFNHQRLIVIKIINLTVKTSRQKKFQFATNFLPIVSALWVARPLWAANAQESHNSAMGGGKKRGFPANYINLMCLGL